MTGKVKPWSADELSDLRNGLRVSEHVVKWGRSKSTIYKARADRGIVVEKPKAKAKSAPKKEGYSGTKHAVTKRAQRPKAKQSYPPRPVTPPSCSYCAGVASADCTCSTGDKCRDQFCLFYKPHGTIK